MRKSSRKKLTLFIVTISISHLNSAIITHSVDTGIYGGSTPFIDGGFPGLPSIMEIQADHVGSQTGGLDINVKAKSNPE